MEINQRVRLGVDGRSTSCGNPGLPFSVVSEYEQGRESHGRKSYEKNIDAVGGRWFRALHPGLSLCTRHTDPEVSAWLP
jgi:hypothetical protein